MNDTNGRERTSEGTKFNVPEQLTLGERRGNKESGEVLKGSYVALGPEATVEGEGPGQTRTRTVPDDQSPIASRLWGSVANIWTHVIMAPEDLASRAAAQSCIDSIIEREKKNRTRNEHLHDHPYG